MNAYKTVVRTAAVFAAALVLALASGAAEPTGTPLGNADIVSMTRAGVSPTLILSRIQASPNTFDLSDQAFMELKANGVADEVLNAMLAANRGAAAVAAAPTGIPALQLPALPPLGGDAAQQGMDALMTSIPPLGGNDDWADFGQDLANLPPPPALPAFSAPPGAGQNSSGTSALSQLPTLATPPAPSVPAVAAAPAVPAPAADPFTYAPVASAPAPAAQAFSAPPAAQPFTAQPAFAQQQVPAPAAPAAAGFDAGRFERELITIANGTPEARRGALAWMLANRQQTLPGLRQALGAAARPEMQAGAAQALGALHDQDSLRSIRDLLGSPSPVVRKEAAKTLAQMNDAVAIGAAEQNLGNPVDPLDGLIHLVGYARLVRASERLGTILSTSPSALNRAAAAAALAEIGRGGAVARPALENALANDADPSVRREAARAVAQFHDPASAALLMNACRRDTEVRKVTLEALAEYPESVGFLVGVVGLGADQIAPDESETARASLAALTGQNFGLDGARWSAWFAENASRFGAGSSAPAVAAAPVGGIPGLPGMPESAPSAAVSTGMSGQAGQVDITALGMIVDPSQIPMAPELAEGPAGLGGPATADSLGLLRAPGAGTGAAPGALSANDFGAAGDTGMFGGAAAGAGANAGAAAGGGVGTGRLPTPAGFEEYADDQMWGGSMSSSSMSALPQQPVVTPTPGAPADASASSGLRLALPPMAGGGASADYGAPTDYGATTDYAAQPDASAPIDFSGMDSSTGYAETQPYDPAAGAVPYDGAQRPAAESDPFADPYAAGDPSSFDSYDDEEDSGLMRFPPEYVDRGEDYGYDDGYDDAGGASLPPPPGGGSADTLAFPGDTDAFGLGEPMFGDDAAGGYDDGAFVDGGAGLAMPPPPGGEEHEYAETAEEPDEYADYGYGEYDDGLSDGDADFGGDDFAAFLEEADATASDPETMPEAPPAGPPSGGDDGGTADWAPAMSDPYTLEQPAAASGAPATMELVRGVGLVEREAAAPEPAAATSISDSAAEPELIVPEAPAATVTAESGDAGSWHYVESGDSSSPSSADDGAPDIPIIADDVYEAPEAVEVIPSDPSGRPSRRLRMQR